MSSCFTNMEVLRHGLRALDYRKENRMAKSCELDFVCDIEVMYGLILEGRVEVTVCPGNELENHKVILRDKNEREVDVDWDDLSERAQDRINKQISDYLVGMKLCA